MNSKKERVDDETRLLGLLERLRALGLSEHPLKDLGLGPPQLALLAQIAQHPGCRLKDVAEGLRVRPPTASVAVRHLEKKGLVERRPDPGDRRAVKLHLTPKGASLHRRAEGFRQEKAKRVLAGLSSEEQRALLELLQRALERAEYDDAC